jgi:hypothetical protein
LKWEYILEDTIKKDWDDFIFSATELSLLPDFVIAGMRSPERVYLNASFNNFGNLTLATLEPLSNEHAEILLRFAKVFDLTYTRFNDLKQAKRRHGKHKFNWPLKGFVQEQWQCTRVRNWETSRMNCLNKFNPWA